MLESSRSSGLFNNDVVLVSVPHMSKCAASRRRSGGDRKCDQSCLQCSWPWLAASDRAPKLHPLSVHSSTRPPSHRRLSIRSRCVVGDARITTQPTRRFAGTLADRGSREASLTDFLAAPRQVVLRAERRIGCCSGEFCGPIPRHELGRPLDRRIRIFVMAITGVLPKSAFL